MEIKRDLKTIEEMADILCDTKEHDCQGGNDCLCIKQATALYDANYRRQSEDTVEVVRCKDCKNCLIYEKWNKKKYFGCSFNGEICEVEGNHYCSYGERK